MVAGFLRLMAVGIGARRIVEVGFVGELGWFVAAWVGSCLDDIGTLQLLLCHYSCHCNFEVVGCPDFDKRLLAVAAGC